MNKIQVAIIIGCERKRDHGTNNVHNLYLGMCVNLVQVNKCRDED